ncbi:hypothetical protein B0H12DRAFT_268527 [Mycena haematopus]|nr:hypothetical protein B0H12DRAFT_268527 [Mycena haematopus]
MSNPRLSRSKSRKTSYKAALNEPVCLVTLVPRYAPCPILISFLFSYFRFSIRSGAFLPTFSHRSRLRTATVSHESRELLPSSASLAILIGVGPVIATRIGGGRVHRHLLLESFATTKTFLAFRRSSPFDGCPHRWRLRNSRALAPSCLSFGRRPPVWTWLYCSTYWRGLRAACVDAGPFTISRISGDMLAARVRGDFVPVVFSTSVELPSKSRVPVVLASY